MAETSTMARKELTAAQPAPTAEPATAQQAAARTETLREQYEATLKMPIDGGAQFAAKMDAVLAKHEAPPQGACAECLGVCWHLVSQTPHSKAICDARHSYSPRWKLTQPCAKHQGAGRWEAE